MANSDKNIVITPNRGQTGQPEIAFTGANNTPIRVRVLDDGSLSFESSNGQLFSIVNTMTGSLFSVNDISGIPSIEVLDTGLVKFAEFGGNVLVGALTDNGRKLQVAGTVSSTAGFYVGANEVLHTGNFSASNYPEFIGPTGPQGAITLSSATAPSNPSSGQIWFDTESLKTYVWYDSFWVEVGSSEVGTIYNRTNATLTTSTLEHGTGQNVTGTGFKSYVLMKISTSCACWVRIYSDAASRVADSARPYGTDASDGSGLIAEFATVGSETIKITPFIFGGNLEATPTTDIYTRITNMSGASAAVTVNLTILRLEI